MSPIDLTRIDGPLSTRRAFLQVGYSGLLGMGLPGLLAGRVASAASRLGGRSR